MNYWLGLLGTAGLFISFVSSAYAGACAMYPRAQTGIRLVTTFVGAVWIHAVLFHALAIPGLFNSAAAVAVMALLGLATYALLRPPERRDVFWGDVDTCRGFLRLAFTGPSLLLTLALLVVVGIQLIRSLVIPPVAWDSLTYHLVRAALWIQGGGLEATGVNGIYDAPMAWEYFRAFLPIGDSLSAWAMLLPKSDVLVPLVWVFVWVGGLQATYQASRSLGAPAHYALAAAAAAWTMPTLAKHAFVAHIDNLLVALTVASLVMFVHAWREEKISSTAYALAALGICAAVKPTAAPFVGAGVLAWATLLFWRHRSQIKLALATPLPALIVALPAYIYTWAAFGSPTYPFPLEVGGEELFAGSPEWVYVMSHETSMTWWDYVTRLVLRGPYGDYITHINFGPVLPFAVLLGLVALFKIYRYSESPRLILTYYWLAAITGAILLLSSYTWTGNTIARHIAAGPVLLVACAGTLRYGIVRGVLGLVTLGNLVLLLPFNWGNSDLEAVLDFGTVLAPFLLVAGAAMWWGWKQDRRRFALASSVAVLSILFALVFVLEPIRQDHRYRVYKEAAHARLYSNIKLGGGSGVGFKSASVWKAVDKPDDPLQLAVAGGWDGRGINLAVYPLFGSRLQNTLNYVPVTLIGDVVSPRRRSEFKETANYANWRKRLLDAEIDYVVTIGPNPLELKWMKQHPAHFRRVAKGEHRDNTLYRVLR
jgi:hypothetical protein